MTLNKAAWAIDGPTINASLARTQAFDDTEGVVKSTDLKVTALASPGVGVRIAAGAASILNAYQGSSVNQTYTITNTGTHTVPSSSMPSAAASAKNYIVCVVVGDFEFSATGHPFMPATKPTDPAVLTAFEYVRAMVIEESAFNARNYPALALARIAIPAGAYSVTDAMITDLRALARPRSWLAQSINAAPAGGNGLNSVTPAVERFPDVAVLTVKVPKWAVRAKVIGYVEGVRLDKAGVGGLRPQIASQGIVGATTNIDEYTPKTQRDRRTYNVGGEMDVRTLQGQTVTFNVYAFAATTADKNFLLCDANTSVALSVYFEEIPT